MNPSDQARVLQRQADPFEALLVEYVRAAADALVSLVPMMKGVQIDAIEDDLTAFIQHLLAARVQFLGWSVSDQSKGGFSAKGNPGERDLVIAWGSSVLALIEAVICDKPLTQDAMKADLESHFQKLLGYGNPRVFFHLTYAYLDDKQGLMQFLETSAESASPPGFTYLGRDPIPHDDSRPPGFVARVLSRFWRGESGISCVESRSAAAASGIENRGRDEVTKGAARRMMKWLANFPWRRGGARRSLNVPNIALGSFAGNDLGRVDEFEGGGIFGFPRLNQA